MSGNVVTIDGKPVEEAPTLRSKDVAELIEHVTKLNDSGRLRGLAFVAIHDDHSTAHAFAAGPLGFNPTLMIGALDNCKSSVRRRQQPQPWVGV